MKWNKTEEMPLPLNRWVLGWYVHNDDEEANAEVVYNDTFTQSVVDTHHKSVFDPPYWMELPEKPE